jgi:hypothetical protein
LAKLPPQVLEAKIADGSISPELERKGVAAMVRVSKAREPSAPCELTPSAEDKTPRPDKPSSELKTALDIVSQHSSRSDEWPKAMKAIGSEQFQRIVETLRDVFADLGDKTGAKSAVESAADRAEAKAAGKMH